MRKTIYILLLGLLTIILSCEKNGLIVPCGDCFIEEPERPIIKVKFSNADPAIGAYYIKVNVYDGNLEDSILIHTDKVPFGENWTFEGYFNKKYTFTATYTVSSNTYITVDSSFPKVRLVDGQCEEPCYYVYGNNVNLRLKYPDF